MLWVTEGLGNQLCCCYAKKEEASNPLGSEASSFFIGAPGMGDNSVVRVHYRLGSRNC